MSLHAWADKVSKAFGFETNGIHRIKPSERKEALARQIHKAMPKKSKETPVKQAKPATQAGRKMAGKGGKTRYGYDSQGKEKAPQNAAQSQPQPPPKPSDGDAPPAQPEPPSFVDPNKLATLLQTTSEVLKRVAKRFTENPKLGGKQGFVKFFQNKFQDLLEKHSIQTDYLGMLYTALTAPEPQ